MQKRRALVWMRGQPRFVQRFHRLVDQIQRQAVELTLQDDRVRQRLDGVRHRVVGAGLRYGKPTGESGLPPPVGEVGIYDYDQNLLVLAVIDLPRGRIIGLEERSGRQPPLSEEERTHARAIALGHSALAPLRRQGLDVAAFPAQEAFTENHPCHGHRCFTLYFWTRGRRPRRIAAATVDLSMDQVVGDPEVKS